MGRLTVITGTIKDLKTWTSKKGLEMGVLHLEVLQGLSIRSIIFPDSWEKLKTHLSEEMEITAVGRVNSSEDFVILIFSITIFPIPQIDYGNEWLSKLLDLIKIQQQKDYKPGWLIYRLKELNPPLAVWKLCAQYLGKKEGWGFYQWRELNPIKKKSKDICDYGVNNFS